MIQNTRPEPIPNYQATKKYEGKRCGQHRASQAELFCKCKRLYGSGARPHQYTIDPHRLRNVFKFLIAQIFKADLDPAFDVVEDGAGNADAANLGEPLQPRRDVDAVTVNVLTVNDDVAEVDADAQSNALFFR